MCLTLIVVCVYNAHMKTNLPATFKKARKLLGLTQEEFARLLGKGRTDVTKYETGKVTPPGNIVELVYNILERNKTKNEMP